MVIVLLFKQKVVIFLYHLLRYNALENPAFFTTIISKSRVSKPQQKKNSVV
jgi:hypothetical protein